MTGMSFTTRPEIRGTFGAVASTHWLASQTAMAILERGGNAFDAAVAGGFVLQVVEPHLNGPGGEVPIALKPAGGAVEIVCGQGPAPRAATIQAYRDQGLEVVPGTGLLAATVPGAFDAWMLLLRDHGSLPLRDVLEPAIQYARHGYPLVPRIAGTIETVAGLFRDEWPTSAALYLPDNRVPTPGKRFANPTLADTYERLVREAEGQARDRDDVIEAARHVWAEGFVAEAIAAFCRTQEVMDTSGARHAGLLDGDDLAAWRATKEAPVARDYHGWRVHKAGAWSQGPVLLQQLALLEGVDLDRMAPTGAEFVHTVTEAAKLAFADRELFYGDPDFVDVPLETLLSDTYAEVRRKLIGREASRDLRPGDIPGYGGDLNRLLELALAPPPEQALGAFGGGEPTVQDDRPKHGDRQAPGDTCHIDVIDRHGNAVTATPSGGWLQSSPVIPDLGFCLGTRAQMFWLEDGQPASLAPGKRPRTTLSVSLATHADGRVLAIGTPGGDYQDQWTLHAFLRHVHAGHNLQEAIEAPGFKTDHMPSSFYPRRAKLGTLDLESRFPEETFVELGRRGHHIGISDPWSLGRVTAVGTEDGLIKAGANPRGMQGYAVGR
ncbi:gamma-glutamyltransferase [Rhodovibrio salinarum]|uniref:Gamma-glutamyltransferase n=2 Tax=Rhodovibrio salinarum TaxID=1087 RepID=A0A934V262_9PROT|nr:gamma-glutamyltransferase family protein [Rhodovibrio salinarum]MBK1698609.1 gamma-glutamyltransferase [Rhodovibrio salinarum]